MRDRVFAALAVVAIGVLLLSGVGSGWGRGPGAGQRTGPDAAAISFTPQITALALKSTSWAGYMVTSATGSVTDVQANWNVPQIAAACPKITTGSVFFVGFNGINSNPLLAIGTDTNCVSGSASYAAFIEAGTASGTLALKISPADHMFGQVKFKPYAFTFTLKDLTTGKSYTKTLGGTLLRYTAEWIADDPTSYAPSLYPLTDFGWVTFRNASATIGGHTHSIGGFTPTGYTMWNVAGTKVKVSLGTLTNGGSQFVATWKARGP